MMRIGLFGGSFDPVHLGHLLVAQAACEELLLDRLFFIPAAQSPFKPESQPASAELRLRMLRLALVGKSNYEIDDQEIHRGGISFTVDTVRDYTRRFPKAELYYLIGADHVSTLPKWRDADELAQTIQFVVIPRPGEMPTPPSPPFSVTILRGWPLGLSSSHIRARVRAAQPIGTFVPPGVEEVIHEAGLYEA
jgi:nicotinate-nucleotide adenylyltransferase